MTPLDKELEEILATFDFKIIAEEDTTEHLLLEAVQKIKQSVEKHIIKDNISSKELRGIVLKSPYDQPTNQAIFTAVNSTKDEMRLALWDNKGDVRDIGVLHEDEQRKALYGDTHEKERN